LVPQQAGNVYNHPVDGSESGMIDNIDPQMSLAMALYTCMKAPIDKKLLDEVLLMDIIVSLLRN